MYLDYSKLAFDKDGMPETPELILKTLDGETIGIIHGVFNLKLNVKFSEPSEISFDIPATIDGAKNPLYDDVSGYRQIYTKCYGVYVIMNPTTEADGISEVKHVRGYSLEKVLEAKKFFIEEGTFNFWNPASRKDTVIGRILEIAVGWSPGYIAPSLVGRYRTFDGYDDYLLSFMYNQAPQKFRCVFVFDTYNKTINAYDADAALPTLPIYLDFDNLLETLDIEEMTDELVTAIRPYGADDLDIRDVNPIGTNWVYDLSYFIANGDIPTVLANKWTAWQRSILNRQPYYKSIVALRASTNARLLSEQAVLTDLKGELETLVAQQSVTIQAIALEKTEAGKKSQEAVLRDINQKIALKKGEIASKTSTIASINSEIERFKSQIQSIVNELAIDRYFTPSEYTKLSHYFIEQDVTEDTFVATTVDEKVSGTTYSVASGSISISGSKIERVSIGSPVNKTMYTMSGGTFSLSGSQSVTCDIIRGTLETSSNGSYVVSFYAGTIRNGGKTAPSGMITMSGTYSGVSSNITSVNTDGVTSYEGTSLSFSSRSSNMFLTANVNEYQRYSVQMELFEYAVNILDDLATPTYEFSVDSGNFLFAKEFAPFRNKLELGKGVYLNVGGNQTITPYIIEFELSFEERNRFSIIFSNRFKRHDYVNTLKDMLEKSYSTSRNFDASKYIYNQTSGQMSSVTKFLADSLDAAKNTILAAANQSVVIDGAGIHVGGDSKYEIRIVDRMIAMTDDGWNTAKMAIGLFASPEIGEYWGVNAEVIGGKLIVGNNLIIENETDRGILQFRVDSSGAWLYNASFVLQSNNGLMILDPDFGIAAGTKMLFDTNGTIVTPEFLDRKGNITYDSDGMPRNANFYLDIRDGNAYFRGKLIAKSGLIGGFTIAEDYLHCGSGGNFVALNGSGTNSNSIYAIWAGAQSPSSAPFWVKKNGEMCATNGTFTGTLKAARISGTLTGESGSWIEGCGIRVGKNSSATKGYNFYVDGSGNVWMQGNLTLANGSITWENLSPGAQGTIDGKISAGITASENKLTLFVQNTKSALEKEIAKIELSYDKIGLSVSNLEKEIAQIEMYAKGIKLSVSNGETSSYIELKSGSAVISSATITMRGLVTFEGLSSGTTTINGACIKTGKIDANYINLTGAITFNDLSWSVQDNINGAYNSAANAQATANDALRAADDAYWLANDIDRTIGGWVYRGTTYIDGSCIMTGTIMVSKLYGGIISLLDSREYEVGSIVVTGTNSGYGVELQSHTGGIRINPRDDFWVDAAFGSLGVTSSGVVCGADCVPLGSNRYSLGSGRGLYWSDAYVANGSINSSNRDRKKEIDYDMAQYSKIFDALRPCSFLRSDGTSGRRHHGMVAQDVLQAVEEAGLTSKDFAAFCSWDTDDGGTDCGLRYEEFIAMLIFETQQLKKKISKLNEDIADLTSAKERE